MSESPMAAETLAFELLIIEERVADLLEAIAANAF